MSSTISQIKVTIGGVQSNGFTIELDQVQYRLSDFVLNQSMLAPNSLMFSMHKVSTETIQDTQFYVCGQIIGRQVTVSVDLATVLPNFQKNTDETYNANLYFDGVIVSANGVRGQNAEYSIQVQAMGWECLLDSNPDCRSFTDKTLEEIVKEVVGMVPFKADSSYFSIHPRFQERIPYCVMYNETHYQFLQRLACRYGEWLYNDGRCFIFGQLPSNRQPWSLKYPSQDVPFYQVNLQIQSFRNENVSCAYISDGHGTAQAPQPNDLFPSGQGGNGLLNATYQASRYRYSDTPRYRNLHSGGYSDLGYWPNDLQWDGKTLTDIATRSQRFGEKSGLVTYSGKSLCAFVQVGTTLGIVDNYLTGNSSNQKSPVNQHPALITTVTHSFSDNNTYYNCFTGIPEECSYPPYSDPDIYPQCPPCRAWVTDNNDPLGLGRVRVQFGWQKLSNPASKTPFIRIAQPYAGGKKGFSFIPEVGEEVMVDFEGGNAERPYVSGTLYNGRNLPDRYWVANQNQGNQVKAIRTRNGHTIEFHDEGNAGGYIYIYDNGRLFYRILLSTDRKLIRLESAGNIELYAAQDIILEANNKVSIESHQDTIMKAGHNYTRTVECDLHEHIKNDRSVKVEGNDTEVVEGTQRVQVNDTKDEVTQKTYQLSAKTIRLEAQNDLLEYSQIHQQKANGSMSLDGGPSIEIKGAIAKIN